MLSQWWEIGTNLGRRIFIKIVLIIMGQMNIACVIVTFNRCQLLCNCIDAVLNQQYKPSTLYIVNNASSDDTEETLLQMGYINHSHSPITVANCKIEYLYLQENIGGAGGFYTGMKKAFDDGADAVWVMDDDGIPDDTCLFQLTKYLGEYDYIAPMVVDINDPSKLSFEYCGEKSQFEQRAINGLVYNIACPFNGILYSRHLIETIGFPQKEMFIWGDEENYHIRAVRVGFFPVTVIDAIHRHPSNRVMTAQSLLGKIDIAPQMWRCYCRYRNAVYNHREEMSLWGKSYVFFNHVWYYLIKKHSIKWTNMYIHAFFDGLHGDFTKLRKYLK